MTLKGALLLSRLVNRSAHLWFAVQFAVSWCARGERPIDEAIRRSAVGRKNVYSAGSHELPTIEDFETVPSPPSSHVTPEAAKSTSHSSQPATTKQSGSEGLELNGADCGDERSDYELQRARVDVRFLIDTGAAVSLLNSTVWRKITAKASVMLDPWFGARLVGVDGSQLRVFGQARLPLVIQRRRKLL
ncbi:hypothetical protein EMCRGX_G000053 [Ephydatia muelleri]